MVERIYQMGINYTLDVISSKWKPLILCYIGFAPRRNGELLRLIPTISQKVLIQQLRELEDDGIIYRISYPEIPPRIEYHLTERGENLRDILVDLSIWGETRVQELQEEGADIAILHGDHNGYLKHQKLG